jgi:hypothetical protein
MLRKYTAYFKVELWDGEETRIDAGFCSADTFHEAMDYIEEYYGDELCVVHRIELLDMSLLTMTPEVAEEFLDKIY